MSTAPTPSAARTDRKKRRRQHYSVYVVELSRGVLYERKFQKANPNYNPERPCVYVGMTGLDPDVRFDKHKAGIQSNRYVREYGVRLLPALYQAYNPMPYDAARDMEVELAIALREQGFGVWQA
jgi:predicted GIY-YIG superfamily endonuclease